MDNLPGSIGLLDTGMVENSPYSYLNSLNAGTNLGDYANMAQQQSANASSMQNTLDSYPTFQNQFGIGTQSAYSNNSNNNSSNSQADPTSASHGFNPWSLVGEANARR